MSSCAAVAVIRSARWIRHTTDIAIIAAAANTIAVATTIDSGATPRRRPIATMSPAAAVRHINHAADAANPAFAAFARDTRPPGSGCTGCGTKAGNADGRSTTLVAHCIHGADVIPASLRVWYPRRPPPPPAITADSHALTTSAASSTHRAPRDVNAVQAQAAGIASGRSSGTRNRAGPLNPAHHMANVVTDTRYGAATRP